MGKLKYWFKSLKYIVWSAIEFIVSDFTTSYHSMVKPKEVMNLLLMLFFMCLIAKQYEFLKVIILFYLMAYVWHVIRDGDWKHKMRTEYNKKARQELEPQLKGR